MKSPDPRKGLHLLPPQTVRVQTWVPSGSRRLSVFSSCLLLSVCHCQQITGVTTVPPRPHLGHAPAPPTQEPALGILITPRVAQKIWNKCKLLFAVLGWTEFIQNNYLKLAHMNLTWVGREASLLLLLLVFILLGLECDNRNSEHCDDEPSHDWQRKYLVYIFSFHEIFSVYLFLYSCLRNWDVSPANQSVIITFISTTIFIRI